jgi:hypothetical protein
MADEWQPANDVERALLDAMQRGEQDRYFEVLGAADLILPFAADATGAAQPGTWATWGYEGRTYILAFTSQQALASIMGRPTDQFRTGRLAEICAWWPDESWWLAVDFGLPIAGYLPGTFVSQLTGVQLGAQLAVADPHAAYRPDQQSDADDGTGQQQDPLQPQQTPPADPGQTVAAVPTDSAAGVPDDASPQPDSGPAYQQPIPAQPGQQPISAQPYQPAGAQPYDPGREQAYPPADAAAQYQQQAGATAPAGANEQQPRLTADGAQPGTVPVLSNGAVDATGFRPASPLEQTLLDASRSGDRKTFMDALLGAYLLVPVPEGATPGPTAVTTPDFPWPSIERNGTPQVPVFTSQERLRERVGAAPYAVVPFVLIVEHWPHREWYLALNPDTPVSATVDGDQIAELAEWARRTHLAERLGVLPPQQHPLVPAQPASDPAGPGTADRAAAEAAPAAPDSAPSEGVPMTAAATEAPERDATFGDAAPSSDDAAEIDAATADPVAAEIDAATTDPVGAGADPATPASDGDAVVESDDDVRAASDGDAAAGPDAAVATAGLGPDRAAEAAGSDEAAAGLDSDGAAGAARSDEAAGGAGFDGAAAAGQTSSDAPGASIAADPDADEPAAHAADGDPSRQRIADPGADEPAAHAADTAGDPSADATDAESVGTATARAEADATAGDGGTRGAVGTDEHAVAEAGAPAAATAGAALAGAGAAVASSAAESVDGAADAPGPDDAAGAAAGVAGTTRAHDDEPAPEWPPVPPAVEDGPAPAEPVPPLSFPALLQKAVPDAQVPFYLERHFDRVGGWIHLAADAPVRAGDLRVATGLSGEVAAEPVHAIRWHVEAEELLPVLAAVGSAADPELVEYRVPTARLPHGAELYRIDPDGATTVLAVFNADHHRWHPLI